MTALTPAPDASAAALPTPAVRGLFQIHTDPAGPAGPALLALAGLHFARAGMPAELYAERPEDAESLLAAVPGHPARPTVHLPRHLDLLDAGHRELVRGFARRLGDRVAGLVVHDRPGMTSRTDEVVAAMAGVADRESGPRVHLEYAAGAPFDWFAELADRLATIPRAGLCLDIGHAGVAQARRELARRVPDARRLTIGDPGLVSILDDVLAATAAAAPAVGDLLGRLGDSGVGVHLHLHDGHPALPGLADHFGFLERVPMPFAVAGVRSLPMLYGPAGLAAVLRRAVTAVGPGLLSMTLEVHRARGRRPLDAEAAELVSGRVPAEQAETLHHWLSVVAENHALARAVLDTARPPAPAR